MLARKEPFTKQGEEKLDVLLPPSTSLSPHVLMTDLRPQGEQNQFIHWAVVDDSTLVSVPWLEGLRIEDVLRVREMAELQSTKRLRTSQRQQIRDTQTLKYTEMTTHLSLTIKTALRLPVKTIPLTKKLYFIITEFVSEKI